MREILFRGKWVDNGEWVEGDLIHTPDNKFRIIGFIDTSHDDVHSYNDYNYEVIPSTVGQFTGLTDKNGNKIFEGDHFGNNQFSVSFSDGVFTLGGIPLKGYFNLEYMTQLTNVKGNIHDNHTP